MTQPSPDGYLVPTVRTVVTAAEYARAVVLAWPRILGGAATKAAAGVLWAQYMIETGGAACWGWNIGNVKKRIGDGHNYQALKGVWEGSSPADAARKIAEGKAKPDNSADHAKAVGPGRVSIILDESDPGSWFRVYADLSEAMESHIQFLALGRYASCWPHVLAGDCKAFARSIHSNGYFSANPDVYGAGMARHFDRFMASDAFEAVAPVDPLGETEPDFQAYDMATRSILEKPDPSS